MYRRPSVLFASVLVMMLALTWVFLGMRAVMDIGGTCASGGAYEIANPCPDNVAGFVAIGIPVMLICAFIGTAVAVGLGAPDLLVPMWLLLFGSLGWNFLAYGLFDGDVVWGWAVCGVLFEVMALPALLVLLPWGHNGPEKLRPKPEGVARWWGAYSLLGVAGVSLGWATFNAWT